MSAPYPSDIIAQQHNAIEELTIRPTGALFEDIAEALGIKIGGASYRVNKMANEGKLWVCSDGRSAKKRAFSSLSGMRAWQATQPPPFAEIVQELLDIKQPVTAAQLGAAVGMDPKRASGYLWPMAKRGEIFGTQCGHMWFWYKTPEAAENGRAQAEIHAAMRIATRNEKLIATNRKKRGHSLPAGVVLTDPGVSFRNRTAQITGETKVTIAQPPKYHYRHEAVESRNQSIFSGWPRYGSGSA